MISEDLQDLALAYLLQDLPAADSARFEQTLQVDAELQQFVDDLRESTAALAYASAPQPLPSRLRAQVLAAVRQESSSAPAVPASIARFPWLTPAFALVAACLVLGLIALAVDNYRVRGQARLQQELVETMRGQLAAFGRQISTLQQQNSHAQEQIATLTNRDSLAQVKIATLSAQVSQMAKANAVIVWDSQKQEGVVQLINMPKADPGKDYQLWVIDPKYATPISAGVVPVGGDGTALTAFKPDQPILTAGKFAISIEKAGGVPHGTGPLIFLSE